jgi:hypothetical protein
MTVEKMSKHSRKRHCFPKKKSQNNNPSSITSSSIVGTDIGMSNFGSVHCFQNFDCFFFSFFLFVFVERGHVWLVILRPWSRGTSDLAQSHDRGRKGQVERVLRRTNSRMRCQMG